MSMNLQTQFMCTRWAPTCRGEKIPVTLLFSAIYRGPVTPFTCRVSWFHHHSPRIPQLCPETGAHLWVLGQGQGVVKTNLEDKSDMAVIRRHCQLVYLSGQIIIFHQPRFP